MTDAISGSTTARVLYLLVDNFKDVNDHHGHQAGDQVLQEFSVLVEGGARSSDLAARPAACDWSSIVRTGSSSRTWSNTSSGKQM